jgi:hypothetical protein
MHFLRRTMDVLRRRLRRRDADVSKLPGLLPAPSVARGVAERLPPDDRAALLDRASRAATRPVYRYTLPDDLVILIAKLAMQMSDAAVEVTGEMARHRWNCPGLEDNLLILLRGTAVLSDLVQIVVEETPRPHDQPRATVNQRN